MEGRLACDLLGSIGDDRHRRSRALVWRSRGLEFGPTCARSLLKESACKASRMRILFLD